MFWHIFSLSFISVSITVDRLCFCYWYFFGLNGSVRSKPIKYDETIISRVISVVTWHSSDILPLLFNVCDDPTQLQQQHQHQTHHINNRTFQTIIHDFCQWLELQLFKNWLDEWSSVVAAECLNNFSPFKA